MEKPEVFSSFLGVDIGQVNTGVSHFGISDEKYCLLAAEMVSSTLGYGQHVGTGVGEALRNLNRDSDQVILNKAGRLIMPVSAAGAGVDRVALTTSAGPWLRSALLGLTEKGSLAVGRALVDSMPLKLMESFGLADLVDEPALVDALIQARPELLIITGGSDTGAESALRRWVEVVRLVCRLLPSSGKPVVLFAGNPRLQTDVRRRLEALATLNIAPNLQPDYGEMDLLPAQVIIDYEVMRVWNERILGLLDLSNLANHLYGTKSFALGRIVRYLSRGKNWTSDHSKTGGVLAVDLGGGSTTISAGLHGFTGDVIQPARDAVINQPNNETLLAVQQWTAVPVTLQDVNQFLSQHALYPSTVPETVKELALVQALARVRLQRAIEKLAINFPWFSYQSDQGLTGQFEPVIASGKVLTQAPTPGQAMLMLLDGLQPWGITTMVLDLHQITPLLGVIAGIAPVLPVHLLESDAFKNLGTVVPAVSTVPAGEVLLNIQVNTDSGKDYSIEIVQGSLKHLVIPEGVTAVLELEPKSHTNVGFGAFGKGGRLKIKGGLLGVVIDARGRPVKLIDDESARVEQFRRWLWALGG